MVVFMCLALVTEVVTIIWTLITCSGCCFKAICMRFLPILAFIIALFLAVALGVFAGHNSDSLSKLSRILKNVVS